MFHPCEASRFHINRVPSSDSLHNSFLDTGSIDRKSAITDARIGNEGNLYPV